jgi:ankyrin repeat protein
MVLPDVAVLGDAGAVRQLLDRGANVNAFDGLGRTPLMYAAASDLLALDVVKLLIDRGADVNASDRHKDGGDSGLTVVCSQYRICCKGIVYLGSTELS